MPHPSVEHTLELLQKSSPNSPFLALGQTVFWDEPVKAVWRRILDRHWPAAQLVAGIHDTDYFAKTTAHVPDDVEFIALAHDDGATRGLWSAAGELSAFLGSEDLPTRASFESIGLPFDELAGRDASVRRRFFADFTSAYGWRGVVQTSGTAQIAHDVPLSSFGPALLELLDWGFQESLSNLDGQTAERGKDVLDGIRGWVVSFLDNCTPECTLTDLYQHLLPKFYELLLDFEPSNFSVTSTASILKFSPATAGLPRFGFVQIFLDPATSATARAAYSKAVAGGGMYALDHFGEGALPFDVVVPGQGRGTLHVVGDAVTIDFTPVAQTIVATEPVTTVDILAKVLSAHFGDRVVLVGKAVALISMLSAEFILIFHETASGYTDRTAGMNEELRGRGVDLKLNPLLRLQYNTWDSLTEIPNAGLLLPSHLDNAFGTVGASIPASMLGERWRNVVASQQELLNELQTTHSLRGALTYLEAKDLTGGWNGRRQRLEEAVAIIKDNYNGLSERRLVVQELKQLIAQVKTARKSLEKLSGDDYRTRMRPLQLAALSGDADAAAMLADVEHERRQVFTEPLLKISAVQRDLKKKRKAARAAKRSAERPPHVLQAAGEIFAISREANTKKLQIARSAYLTVHGMPHINSRPTAWWLPMVDPTGAWFDQIAETVEARLETV